MSNIRNWSKTPASNNSAPPAGAPEGQLPSTVNDIMRQQMADHRTQWEDAEFFDWGHTLVRQGNGSFLVSVTATQIYTAGRRLKLYDTTTIFAEVLASGPSGANTLVSVSGSNLSSSLSSGAVGILNPALNSLPAGMQIEDPIISGSISGSVLASQSQMEAAAEAGHIVTPTNFRWHPLATKAWCVFEGASVSASRCSVVAGFNVAAVWRNGTGLYTISLSATMSGAEYAVIGTCQPASTGGGARYVQLPGTTDAQTATAFKLITVEPSGGAATNAYRVHVMVLGTVVS